MKLHNRLKRIEQTICEVKKDATYTIAWGCSATQTNPLKYNGNIKPGDTIILNVPREWAM